MPRHRRFFPKNKVFAVTNCTAERNELPCCIRVDTLGLAGSMLEIREITFLQLNSGRVPFDDNGSKNSQDEGIEAAVKHWEEYFNEEKKF